MWRHCHLLATRAQTAKATQICNLCKNFSPEQLYARWERWLKDFLCCYKIILPSYYICDQACPNTGKEILHLYSAFTNVFFFSLLLERGREILMWQRSINWLLPICAWTRGQTRNLGMCPDQELRWQPFSYGTTLQPSHTGQDTNVSFSLFKNNPVRHH